MSFSEEWTPEIRCHGHHMASRVRTGTLQTVTLITWLRSCAAGSLTEVCSPPHVVHLAGSPTTRTPLRGRVRQQLFEGGGSTEMTCNSCAREMYFPYFFLYSIICFIFLWTHEYSFYTLDHNPRQRRFVVQICFRRSH